MTTITITVSFWALDGRALILPQEKLEDYMFSVCQHAGDHPDNSYRRRNGYIWLCDRQVSITIPRLEDRVEGIKKDVEEHVQSIRANAEKQCRDALENFQNLLALTYEAPGD